MICKSVGIGYDDGLHPLIGSIFEIIQMICVSPLGQGRCEPGCSVAAPYCHGRCEGGGRAAGGGACLLHPCSASPYPEQVPATCAGLATAATPPAPCSHLSGAPCWHCVLPLQTLWTQCADTQAAVLLSKFSLFLHLFTIFKRIYPLFSS